MAQRILYLGRIIIINWVPNHIVIQGNELADILTKKGRYMPPTHMIINPSQRLSQSSNTITPVILLRIHRENDTNALRQMMLRHHWLSAIGTSYKNKLVLKSYGKD